MRNTDEPIVVQQTFNKPAVEVWQAITRLDQMKIWFFDNIEDFRPEVGFTTQFNVQANGRNFLHLWTITEVIPLQKITYNWKYGGYAGDSFVIFELDEQKGTTKLSVTCRIEEDFPQDIPEFTRESCIQGWQYFINKSLKEYLDGSVE